MCVRYSVLNNFFSRLDLHDYYVMIFLSFLEFTINVKVIFYVHYLRVVSLITSLSYHYVSRPFGIWGLFLTFIFLYIYMWRLISSIEINEILVHWEIEFSSARYSRFCDFFLSRYRNHDVSFIMKKYSIDRWFENYPLSMSVGVSIHVLSSNIIDWNS